MPGGASDAGMLALADFRTVQGLAPVGGNNWIETYASGQPLMGQPGQGKFGVTRAGALEDSNVDLTAELVNMMNAQRAYQANAQTSYRQDTVRLSSGTISAVALQQSQLALKKAQYARAQALVAVWQSLAALSTASGHDVTGLVK